MLISPLQSVEAVLFGLNEELAGELLCPLRALSVGVRSVQSEMKEIADSRANVIFCAPDTATVASLRASKPSAAVVVVSRLPKVSDWLDALEAGAADYCAAPFEVAQLKWILESSTRPLRSAAAA